MKAIEYVDYFKKSVLPAEEKMAEIMGQLFIEGGKMCTERKVACDEAAVAVINQQNRKWNAIAEKVGLEKYHNMFAEYATHKIPTLKLCKNFILYVPKVSEKK